MKRTDILTAMTTRFNGIVSGSGSYSTTLSGSVSTWRTVPVLLSEVPFLNIRDTLEEIVDDTQGGASGRMTQRRLIVELEVVAQDISTLRSLMKDIETAIAVDETWGGLALRTQPISSEVLASQERDAIAGVLITVRVDYRTGRWSVS